MRKPLNRTDRTKNQVCAFNETVSFVRRGKKLTKFDFSKIYGNFLNIKTGKNEIFYDGSKYFSAQSLVSMDHS